MNCPAALRTVWNSLSYRMKHCLDKLSQSSSLFRVTIKRISSFYISSVSSMIIVFQSENIMWEVFIKEGLFLWKPVSAIF